jgi:hypothetical protein
MFFNLTVSDRTSPSHYTTLSVGNADAALFANATQVSSTPLTYTSKGGHIYYLALVLANTGGGS